MLKIALGENLADISGDLEEARQEESRGVIADFLLARKLIKMTLRSVLPEPDMNSHEVTFNFVEFMGPFRLFSEDQEVLRSSDSWTAKDRFLFYFLR